MLRRTPLAPLFVVVLCTAAADCRNPPPPPVERQETIVPVGVVRAQTAGIRASVHASGLIVPADGGEFLVVAPEPARIAEITKAQGDIVASGEILVRFELPSATQEVARLAAELAGAQAQLENARINQARIRDFAERGFIPRSEEHTSELQSQSNLVCRLLL